jgi:glycosyltransferase involved in cell wall biosynthesis
VRRRTAPAIGRSISPPPDARRRMQRWGRDRMRSDVSRRWLRSKSTTYDVVFYVPTISPLLAKTATAQSGGAETQMFVLTKALATQGVRVAVIAYELPEGMPRHYQGVDVFARPSSAGHVRVVGKVIEVARIWRSLAAIDAPVIVRRMAGVDAGVIAVFARLRRRRYVYSSAHVLDFDPDELFAKRRDRALYCLGVTLAHRVVVQTEEQVPLCERAFGQRPMVIKSIAEPAVELRESHRLGARPEAFLWVGRVCSYKRPLEFVALARAIPDARFRMVAVAPPRRADDDDHKLWRRMQAAARDTENLELLPPMRREDLRLLIQRAIAVVNTADHEGMPNVFLEAWMEGIPALALTHDPGGAIRAHQLGEFAEGSWERFVEIARSMWRDGDERARLAANCLDYVRREHSRETVAAQWASLLAEESGRRSARA